MPFIYVAQFKPLVCSICHFAVQDHDRHLKEKHQVPVHQRRKILTACQRYERCTAAQVTYPILPIAAINVLGAPNTCFACTASGCDFIRAHNAELRQHAYQVHRWRASELQRTLWRSVKAQTLFRDRKLVRYFIVQDEGVSGNEESNPPSTRRSTSRNLAPQGSHSRSRLTTQQQSISQQFMQKWKVQREKTEVRLQQLENEQANHDRTGWWNLNQWPSHFSKCNLNFLAHHTRLPDKDELVQQNAVEVVNIMLSRAVAGLTSLHREERRWLRSPKVSDPDVRPLARLQEPDSQDRYHNYWRRFVCYLLRVWQSKQEFGEERRVEDEREDGESDSGEERDLHTPDNSEDEDESKGEETATPDTEPTDTLKDARRLLVLSPRQVELLHELNEKLLADDD